MTVTAIDHVSVTVLDLDRSLAFYHGLLRLPILGRGEEKNSPATGVMGTERAHYLYADLDLGSGQILELLQYSSPQGTPVTQRVFDPGSGHIGLRVDDLAAVLRRLEPAGVRARSPPVELDEPAWWRGARCVYVTDPDGVTVELVERP